MITKEVVEKESRVEGPVSIHGTVRWDGSYEPVRGMTVQIYHLGNSKPLGDGKTDKGGCFDIHIPNTAQYERVRQAEPTFFIVKEQNGRVLLNTQASAVIPGKGSYRVNLLIPQEIRQLVLHRKRRARPKIRVGSLLLDAERVKKLTPEDLFNLARIVRKHKVSEQGLKRIRALSPELLPTEKRVTSISSTPMVNVIYKLIELKEFPADVILGVQQILTGGWFEELLHVYETANFTINYYLTGSDAVDSSTAAMDIYEPGSDPPVLIGTLEDDGVPTYVKLVAFWMERALSAYVSPPFSMLNPAAAGRIPVNILSYGFGGAGGGHINMDRDLPPEVLCAVAVHELFHLVQDQYLGEGSWWGSIREGGAVVFEDAAADLMNRYLDEAGVNFNGTGTQANPNLSLFRASYKACLFLRYLAEQASSDLTEPYIGVETYRSLIEHASAGNWSTDDIKEAIEELPWYQKFYEFTYLDAARLDCTNAETLFGNYALACYLKDLGANVPDNRFDFIEDEENIYIDDVVRTIIPDAPLHTTLSSVTLSSTDTLTLATAVLFNGSVNEFAHCYYEVQIDPGVTNINVQFMAAVTFTSHIFQIVLIDEDGLVRDIHRTDKSTYTKFITNLCGEKRLDRILLVVSGANGSGDFTLNVSSADPAPDVMVTRWHSVMKTEYEISSYNWRWTWVSPDVWVDNNDDGLADGTVYFDYDNHLHIQLHNKGNLDADGIQVDLHYQDATCELDDASWLPVQNNAGVTQILTGLTLAAGASHDWAVDWSPAPSGNSHHFCIRAVVTLPGDPNTDNKRVLSNFGNVTVNPWRMVDIPVVRRNPLDRPERIDTFVIPRLSPDLFVELLHLPPRLIKDVLAPDEAAIDFIHIQHWPVAQRRIAEEAELRKQYPFSAAKRLQRIPDCRGYYPADPRTLPPGVAGKPLITIVNKAGNHLLGGITLMVTIEEKK